VGERIVLPPPELDRVEGQLQTIFARFRLLVLDCNTHLANEDHAVRCQGAKPEQVRNIRWVFKAEGPAW